MRNVACKKCPLSTQSGHRWLKSPSEPIGLVINAPTAYRDAVQEPTLEQLVGEAPLSDCRQIGRAHSELQSLMRISYAVFCLKKKKQHMLTPTSPPISPPL